MMTVPAMFLSPTFRRLLAGAAFLAAALAAATAPAAPPDAEVTPASQAAVDKGLVWLLANQNEDGSWGCKQSQAPSTAITALSCLALMAAGSTPDRGPHREPLRRGLAYTLSIASRSGRITASDSTGMGPLYDHSCATLFLAEVYATSPEPEENVRRTLGRAVQYIARMQNPDGGWGLQGSSDVATTAAMWTALRAAHNAGLTIHGPAVGKVEAYVRSCADKNGGFAYSPQVRGGGGHLFYPTTAALRVLYGMGRGDEADVAKGTEVILGRTLGDEYGGRISEWDYCGAFYASQALLHENGPRWERWFPRVRDHLVRIQNADGSWTIEYCRCCQAYATALSCLTLQTPGRLLPVFQL
jgi:squalene cyclase